MPFCLILAWRFSLQFGRSYLGISSNAIFPIKAGFLAFQEVVPFSSNVHPLQQKIVLGAKHLEYRFGIAHSN